MAETTTTTLPSGGSVAATTAGRAHGSGLSSPPSALRTPLNKIYALPAPIRTFPLPSFYPSNPVSLCHLVYAWLRQALSPPPAEPSVIHRGIWDPDTRSVHVVDPESIRALWEQGFYGKGSLSRSEPNWLKRELARRGSEGGRTVSEVRTEARREERRLAKWERAKTELEALERQRLAEAEAAAVVQATSEAAERPSPNALARNAADAAAIAAAVTEPVVKINSTVNGAINGHTQSARAPAEPAKLLALPNSAAIGPGKVVRSAVGGIENVPLAPTGPAELLALPNSAKANGKPHPSVASTDPVTLVSRQQVDVLVSAAAEPKLDGSASHGNVNGSVNGSDKSFGNAHVMNASAAEPSALPTKGEVVSAGNGSIPVVPSPPSSATSGSGEGLPEDSEKSKSAKRRKSVRFSPTVESTTFQLHDPPSPKRSAGRLSSPAPEVSANGSAPVETTVPVSATSVVTSETPADASEVSRSVEVVNKEHFQVAPEEAFFLVFALAALTVVDPVTSKPIPTERLLELFRSYSYFPPRDPGHPAGLQPNDSFLVHYAVYHHFRSLGWVPRHGIKFGVDWILYKRGPVFDHSEFGVMVMPTFSDQRWKGHNHDTPKRSWAWLMGVNRVLSHVLKSLVLVYVDVPPPEVFDQAMNSGGISAALAKYSIREVMVRRFSANRNR